MSIFEQGVIGSARRWLRLLLCYLRQKPKSRLRRPLRSFCLLAADIAKAATTATAAPTPPSPRPTSQTYPTPTPRPYPRPYPPNPRRLGGGSGAARRRAGGVSAPPAAQRRDPNPQPNKPTHDPTRPPARPTPRLRGGSFLGRAARLIWQRKSSRADTRRRSRHRHPTAIRGA